MTIWLPVAPLRLRDTNPRDQVQSRPSPASIQRGRCDGARRLHQRAVATPVNAVRQHDSERLDHLHL